MVIPIVMVISYSFRDNVIVEENPVFAGLANYTKVLTDADFLAAMKNTARLHLGQHRRPTWSSGSPSR